MMISLSEIGPDDPLSSALRESIVVSLPKGRSAFSFSKRLLRFFK